MWWDITPMIRLLISWLSLWKRQIILTGPDLTRWILIRHGTGHLLKPERVKVVGTFSCWPWRDKFLWVLPPQWTEFYHQSEWAWKGPQGSVRTQPDRHLETRLQPCDAWAEKLVERHWDFWPMELWDNQWELFKLLFVLICYVTVENKIHSLLAEESWEMAGVLFALFSSF